MAKVHYGARIAQALAIERPQDSVESIKSTVIAELQALDPRMRLKTTEYFNHSYVPDLVASWPSDPASSERYIYLRLNSEAERLLEDIELVQENHPIIFGLDETRRASDNGPERLEQTSRDTNTLITDAWGVERFIPDPSSRFLRLVATAVAQGGRGILDRPAAANASNSLAQGFEGALHTRELPTKRAVGTIATLLNERHAGRITRLLQAVWIGAGGRLEDFPWQRSLVGDVADDALQFLLEYDDIVDQSFWRRLGRLVTVAQLARLDLPSGSGNLDRLVQSNLDLLWARSCRVRSEDDRLSPEIRSELFWFIDSHLLGLKGAGFAAYLAEHADELSRVRADVGDGISIGELLTRSVDVAVNEAELSTGDRVITYASETEADVVHDQQLARIAETLGSEVLVKRVGVTLNRARHLSCDFTTATATGRTSSQLTLPELLTSAVPLLRRLPADEREELLAMLSTPPPEHDQLSFL
jgi:hypothetical protein